MAFASEDRSLNLNVQPSASSEKSSGVGFYFDTVVTVTLYGADADLLPDIWKTCARYENLLSKTVTGSDVYRINNANGQPVTVDPETWDILKEAAVINQASHGAFSISIAPVVSLWDFTGGTKRMPTQEELAVNLPLVDDSAIVLGEDGTVTLKPGMQIDLGGIAKGYIADKVAALTENRCMGCSLSLGGNTYVTGHKPNGTPWNIGIQDPNADTGTPMLVISLEYGSAVTSGTYERFFEKDGVRYHHILDPETGYSTHTDLVAATLISDNSMKIDALATACIVLGSEKALELLDNMQVDGLLITTDGQQLTTDGFRERYHMQSMR